MIGGGGGGGGWRRAYTDTYNCGDPLTDWTLLQKSGEHVNTHITDGLDEVIYMNKLGCNGEDHMETLYKRVPPCNQG